MAPLGLGFFGAYDGRFDDKNRIALPSKLRRNATGEWTLLFYYITPRATLRIVGNSEWKRMQARFDFYGTTNQDVETYKAFMMDMSGDATIDTQGRMLVGEQYLPYIGVDGKNREVRIMGSGGYIDIWGRNRIEAFKGGERSVFNKMFEDYQGAASRLVL